MYLQGRDDWADDARKRDRSGQDETFVGPALLLPAVQAAREAARRDPTGASAAIYVQDGDDLYLR